MLKTFFEQVFSTILEWPIQYKKAKCIFPQTQEEWREKSQEFLDNWQYPFALAAIDGKHIRVLCIIINAIVS